MCYTDRSRELHTIYLLTSVQAKHMRIGLTVRSVVRLGSGMRCAVQVDVGNVLLQLFSAKKDGVGNGTGDGEGGEAGVVGVESFGGAACHAVCGAVSAFGGFGEFGEAAVGGEGGRRHGARDLGVHEMHHLFGGEGGCVVSVVVVDTTEARGVIEGGVRGRATCRATKDHATGVLKGAAKGKPVALGARWHATAFGRAMAFGAVDEGGPALALIEAIDVSKLDDVCVPV